MNLTKCEECGYEISLKTDTCLNCGVNLKKNKKGGIRSLLRRIIIVIIVIQILITVLKKAFK